MTISDPTPIRIPFNRPSLAGKEFQYIREAIDSGWIAGNGRFTKKCQEVLQDVLGAPRVLLTTSCTHALEMAALLFDIGPGDEVIAPSFTFVTTVNAFALRGARPVFADIRPDTLNIDESKIEALITERTRAIIVVHYAGVGCEMDAIMRIAAGRGLPVVEDNAHGLFGKYRGRPLGTFGAMSTLSFHETKNIICGEGGALVMTDPRLFERAEIIREKGTDRGRFFRGQVDKYTWVDLGSSYLPSDMNAAYLFAQLESWPGIQEKRRGIWERYRADLSEWAARSGVRLPVVPDHCDQSFHMFHLLLPSLDDRQRLIAHLTRRGILAAFHYTPLHLSKMGRGFGAKEGDCPVTEETSDRLLRLPFFNDMRSEEQAQVIEAVREFRI